MAFDLVAELSKDGIIEKLFTIGAIQEGEFKLKSGINSPIYIDMRRVISFPVLYQYVVDLMWQEATGKEFDHLGGVPIAALPYASGMAILYQKSMVMPRKDIKKYGTARAVEGVYKQGDVVLVIEDIVTSGSSILETVDQLARQGLIVNDVIVFLDREQGAKELLAKKGITLHAVCTLSNVLHVLEQRGKIDGAAADKIRSFIQENQF